MKEEQLNRLNSLRNRGLISEEEYQFEKSKIIDDSNGDLLGMDLNTYCMVLHFSQFLGFVIPAAGFIAPVVMWLMKKDDNSTVDIHGKIVLNWIISSLIYYGIAGILLLVLIGYPLLVAIGIANIIFIIVGAMKAKEGIIWKYPFSIQFFKTN